jgi:hypothetical protein
MASISSIRFSESSAMPVRHPATGDVMRMPDGREQVIHLQGMDSPAFRKVMADYQDRIIRKRKPGGAKESESNAIDAVTACTTGWLLEGDDGGELPFSPEAARALYTEHRWLRVQCDEWMGERANYLGESASA